MGRARPQRLASWRTEAEASAKRASGGEGCDEAQRYVRETAAALALRRLGTPPPPVHYLRGGSSNAAASTGPPDPAMTHTNG